MNETKVEAKTKVYEANDAFDLNKWSYFVLWCALNRSIKCSTRVNEKVPEKLDIKPKQKQHTLYIAMHCSFGLSSLYTHTEKRVWEKRRLKLHIYFWRFFFLFICINYAPIVSYQGQRIHLFDVCINLMLIKFSCDLISLNRKLPPHNRMTNRTKIARFQFNAWFLTNVTECW